MNFKECIFRLMILLTVFCLLLTGCNPLIKNRGNENTDTDVLTEGPLEHGFKLSYEYGAHVTDSPIYKVAYRSNTNLFDINNVTLEFSYGGSYTFNISYEREHFHSIPYFDLYFTGPSEEKILVKRVNENFVSKKYSYTTEDSVKDGIVTETYTFNHTETLTIPKELFTKDKGQIYFSIYGEDKRDKPVVEYKLIISTGISYKIEGEKVWLSNKSFN